jgi:hypothetical protein
MGRLTRIRSTPVVLALSGGLLLPGTRTARADDAEVLDAGGDDGGDLDSSAPETAAPTEPTIVAECPVDQVGKPCAGGVCTPGDCSDPTGWHYCAACAPFDGEGGPECIGPPCEEAGGGCLPTGDFVLPAVSLDGSAEWFDLIPSDCVPLPPGYLDPVPPTPEGCDMQVAPMRHAGRGCVEVGALLALAIVASRRCLRGNREGRNSR